MDYYKWTYNGTTYDQVDPFKIISVEDDPNYGETILGSNRNVRI